MAAPSAQPLTRRLERHVHPGLLGLRFWDVATGTPVATQHELRVEARDARGVVVEATANRSGVWHFPRLPGINAVEVAAVRAANGSLSQSPPMARPFVVSVRDPSHRFLEVEVAVLAPVEGGLLDWPFAGLPEAGSPSLRGYVPLFSNSSRLAPPGFLAARADLWDIDADRPAAWALLEVTAPVADGTATYLGLADERGSVAVFLPVPFVPVDGTRLPAPMRSWNVGVRAWYSPSLTIDRASASPPVPAILPSLEAIVAQLEAPPATVLASRMPDTGLTTATIRLTEPLVLRTDPAGLDPRHQSFLLIQRTP